MSERKNRWIRGKRHDIFLAVGEVPGYIWKLRISINTGRGEITTRSDKPLLHITDVKKARLRIRDRRWFVKQCGKEYMSNKEVDHDWNADPVWARIVSPMVNGGRRRISCGYGGRSFVDCEEWLEELYQGEHR